MLRSVQAILHPPELKGPERRRYWVAVVGWFGCMLGMLCVFFLLYFGVFYLLERAFGQSFLNNLNAGWVLVPMGAGGVITIQLSDHVWYRLFVLSGYLSDAATIRILSNRAPTQVSERRHRWIGPAVLLLIYGTFGTISVMHRQWWVLVIVVPLALWGVFLIRNAWKEVDTMLQGGPIPAASEERIEYIEKVLEERRRDNAGEDAEPLK